MNDIRILHIADVHIGRKHKSLSARKALVRENEVLLTLKKTISDFADAELVLLAGDIFEEDCPKASVLFVSELFNEHKDKKFLIACGNHDCLESAPIKLLRQHCGENVHVFSDTLECIEFDDIGVRAYGISFCAPNSYASLISGFSSPSDEYINIMVMHADVASDSCYNPVSKEEISLSGLDYLALGHVHSYSSIAKAGNTLYAYPGVPEPGGFDETGSCGVIYGSISKQDTDLNFYPVSQREYHIFRTDVTGMSSDAEVLEHLKSSLNKDFLYRIILCGYRNNFVPDIELYRESTEAFYIEFSDETMASDDILNYAGELSLRGKTADALLDLRDSYDDKVFDRACRIITELMCRE